MEWISQRLTSCLNYRYIAETYNSTPKIGINDIFIFSAIKNYSLVGIITLSENFSDLRFHIHIEGLAKSGMISINLYDGIAITA